MGLESLVQGFRMGNKTHTDSKEERLARLEYARWQIGYGKAPILERIGYHLGWYCAYPESIIPDIITHIQIDIEVTCDMLKEKITGKKKYD